MKSNSEYVYFVGSKSCQHIFELMIPSVSSTDCYWSCICKCGWRGAESHELRKRRRT